MGDRLTWARWPGCNLPASAPVNVDVQLNPSLSSEWQEHRGVDGVTLESGTVAPGTRFRGHVHEGVHLCCVVSGGFVEATSAGPQPAWAGVVRLSPSARHDIDFAPMGASCVVIHLEAPIGTILGALPQRPRFLVDDWLRGLTARLGAAAARGDLVGEVELDGLAVELLAQVARRQLGVSSGAPPAWLRHAREMVHDAAPALQSLSVIAATVGVHRVHLARAFRDHYGEPIRALARRLRLQRALTLLDTDLPLAEIALKAGYADQSHLTREVRRRLGCPPAQLRTRERMGTISRMENTGARPSR